MSNCRNRNMLSHLLQQWPICTSTCISVWCIPSLFNLFIFIADDRSANLVLTLNLTTSVLKDQWRKDDCKTLSRAIVTGVCGVRWWGAIAQKHTGFSTVWCGTQRRPSCLWVYLGHTIKAGRKTDCHLAQFIPPFVYSSVVNAVCLYVWFCSSLHTSALGILKSESTPHIWNIKQILLNMNKWINKPHSVDPQ